jgi:hypothetical protein
MATFVKTHTFIDHLVTGVHAALFSADTDVLRFYLTNTTPSQAADAVKADLAEIATGSGYSGAVDVENAHSLATGTITLACTDKTVTATGNVAQFRWVAFYNDTPSSPADPLLGWYDYGSAVDMVDTDTFTVDFGATFVTLS